jgi:hypothetical protein
MKLGKCLGTTIARAGCPRAMLRLAVQFKNHKSQIALLSRGRQTIDQAFQAIKAGIGVHLAILKAGYESVQIQSEEAFAFIFLADRRIINRQSLE